MYVIYMKIEKKFLFLSSKTDENFFFFKIMFRHIKHFCFVILKKKEAKFSTQI